MNPVPRSRLRSLAVAMCMYSAVSHGAGSPDLYSRIERQQYFDISPRQEIAEALNAWAEQSGMQIIVPEAADFERQTEVGGGSPRVRGQMSARDALERLLEGSRLMPEMINARTVAIRASRDLPQIVTHLAIAPPEEEVFVTGSRLPVSSIDIRAGTVVSTPAPVTIIPRLKIEESGVSTLSELTSHISQMPYGPPTVSENSAQFAELRGLGAGPTLVLVNGRRTLPSATSVAWDAFDLNSIPLGIVDRVEILSDSASAVYGADAIGGVINIVLRNHDTVPFVDLHYGGADGGADERRATFGMGYEVGRLQGSVVFDEFRRGALLGSERDRWRNQDYRRFGGEDWRSIASNPGNVSSVDGENLPGLPSPAAAIPSGSSSGHLTTDDFLATAGMQNKVSDYQYWAIVPEVQRHTGSVTANFSPTDDITAFSEILYARSEFVYPVEPSQRALSVPAQNPFNPFGTDVIVNYQFSGLGPRRSYYASELARSTAGLRGNSGSWNWEVSALRLEDHMRREAPNAINMAMVTEALYATDISQALNVFEGPGGSAALLATMEKPGSISRASSRGTITSFILRGPLWSAPAGDLDFVTGAEVSESDQFLDDALSLDAGRTVKSLFAEARLPVVEGFAGARWIPRLMLTAAARYDEYSDFGSTFNPQFGAVWRPQPDLALRASFGTSFRAPSLFDLNAPQTTFPNLMVPDPRRGESFSSVTFVTGGNADLRPSEGRSLIAGFTWSPLTRPEWQLSGNYWRVALDERVSSFQYRTLVTNETLYPERVVRAPPTAEDVAKGQPGALTLVDVTRLNFGSIETDGVDISGKYAFPVKRGGVAASITATWVHRYDIIDVPGTEATNRVGVANAYGTIARWRGSTTVSWQHAGLSVSATARYTAGYRDTNAFGVAVDRRVSSDLLCDAQARFEASTLFPKYAGWVGTLGISNLFDDEPPFVLMSGTNGFDNKQGDLRQRFMYARVAKTF